MGKVSGDGGGWGEVEVMTFFEVAVFVASLLRVSIRCSLFPLINCGVISYSLAIELSSLKARGLIHYYPITQTKR